MSRDDQQSQDLSLQSLSNSQLLIVHLYNLTTMSDYPTTATSALIDVFQHRVTSPFAISLGLGFAGVSYFTFQNVDTLTWSPVALVGSSKERRKVGLEGNQGQAVELWEWYMKKAVVSQQNRSTAKSRSTRAHRASRRFLAAHYRYLARRRFARSRLCCLPRPRLFILNLPSRPPSNLVRRRHPPHLDRPLLVVLQ